MTKTPEQLAFETIMRARLAKAEEENDHTAFAKYTFALELHPRLWPLVERAMSHNTEAETLEGIAEALGLCLFSLARTTTTNPPAMTMVLLGRALTAAAEALYSKGTDPR